MRIYVVMWPEWFVIKELQEQCTASLVTQGMKVCVTLGTQEQAFAVAVLRQIPASPLHRPHSVMLVTFALQ